LAISDPNLALLIDRWPALLEAVKAAIVALVNGSKSAG